MSDRLIVREYLQSLLSAQGDAEPFSDSEQLVARGRMQSIDTLEVVLFLEQKYAIDFAKIGFDQNQVGSVDSIVELIGRTR
jgi:acyl carrier protein